MPRANRHFLPGYVRHITHRCHKKEFPLKFARAKFPCSPPHRKCGHTEGIAGHRDNIGATTIPPAVGVHEALRTGRDAREGTGSV